jgi:hypothetical protein
LTSFSFNIFPSTINSSQKYDSSLVQACSLN